MATKQDYGDCHTLLYKLGDLYRPAPSLPLSQEHGTTVFHIAQISPGWRERNYYQYPLSSIGLGLGVLISV